MVSHKGLCILTVGLLIVFGCSTKNKSQGNIWKVIREGNAKQLRALIKQYPGVVHLRGEHNFTPLHYCVTEGPFETSSRRELVQILLASGVELDARSDNGSTVLHDAAALGYDEDIQLLIAAGSDINAQDRLGNSPLHNAVLNCRIETVGLLLNKGADVNIQDHRGNTILMEALPMYGLIPPAKDSKLDITKIVFQEPENKVSKLKIFEMLLEKGANPNGKTMNSDEPLLLYACLTGQYEAVQLLLAHGADVNIAYKNGLTGLHMAVMRGNIEIVELLLDKGANVNALTEDGTSPLWYAEYIKNSEMTTLLASRGAKK